MADLTEAERFRAIHKAICDPPKVTPQETYDEDWDGTPKQESLTHWQARAVLKVMAPWLAHDPRGECTCHPGDLMGEGICEYRMLADAVGEAFNPPDIDEAEVAILIGAVQRAREVLAAVRCACTPLMLEQGNPCRRCVALGEFDGKPAQR